MLTAPSLGAWGSFGTSTSHDYSTDIPDLTYGASNPNEGTLSVDVTQEVSHGTLTMHEDNTFTYMPASKYVGPDSFKYRISDGTEESAEATVSISDFDYPPHLAGDTGASGSHDHSINGPDLMTGAYDSDGDPISLSVSTQPEHGSVTINEDHTFTYIPSGHYVGNDSFQVTPNDGYQDGDPITESISVDNYKPVAYPPWGFSSPHDQTINGSDLLAGAYDADGDTFTMSIVDQPEHGILTVNSDHTFSFVPDYHYLGNDSFTYKLNDGLTDSDTYTVNLNVFDYEPVASDEAYSALSGEAWTIDASSGVLLNDTDNEGDPLTAVIDAQPAHGTVSLSSDGSFVYTSDDDYTGSDSFTYHDNDGFHDGNIATVTMNMGKVVIQLGTPTDDDPTWAKLAAGATTTLKVGEQVNLEVAIDGVADLELSDFSWTIPETAVKSFDAGFTSSALTSLTATDKQQGTITFYWTDTGAKQVSIDLKVAQQFNKTVTASFSISKPTATVTTTTSTVKLDPTFLVTGGYDGPAAELGDGSARSDPQSPGIQFHYTSDAADSTLSWRQIVSVDSRQMLADGTYQRLRGNGQIDDGATYRKRLTNYDAIDIPTQYLTSNTRYQSTTDNFVMYLIYTSDRPKSIGIAINKVEWYWSFEASSSDGLTWSLDSSSSSNNPTGVSMSGLPEWTGNVANLNWEADD